MACTDCEDCSKESICKYAGESYSCKVQEIKEAKVIVDCDFENMYNKLLTMNEDLYNDELSSVLNHMRNLIYDSKNELE